MAENSESRNDSGNIYSNIPPNYDIHRSCSSDETNITSTYGRILPRSTASNQGNSFAYCCGENDKYTHTNLKFPWDPSQNSNCYTLPLQKDISVMKEDLSCSLQNTLPKYHPGYSVTCKDIQNVPSQFLPGQIQNTSLISDDKKEIVRDPVYQNLREVKSDENNTRSATLSAASYLHHSTTEKYTDVYNLSSLTPASCTVVNSPIYANLHEVKNSSHHNQEVIQGNKNSNKLEQDICHNISSTSHSVVPPRTNVAPFLGFHVSDSTPVRTYGNAEPKMSSCVEQGQGTEVDDLAEKLTSVSVTKERKKVSFSDIAEEDESEEEKTNDEQRGDSIDSVPTTKSGGLYKEDYKLNTLNSKTLLPYNITPPRQKGPTEAEKKIEALMREIEDEMENNPPESEYFGKHTIYFWNKCVCGLPKKDKIFVMNCCF